MPTDAGRDNQGPVIPQPDTAQSSEAPVVGAENSSGMTPEARRRMNLTWGAVEGLTNPHSDRVVEAAAGDKGMEAVLAMTEGILNVGEEMGISSDKVLAAVGEIVKPDDGSSPEAVTKKSAQVFREAQRAVDAVGKDGAVGVWMDYEIRDEYHPVYITLFDSNDAAKFNHAVEALRSLPPEKRGSDYVTYQETEGDRLRAEIKALVAEYCGGEPERIYGDGEWKMDPEKIIGDWWEQKQQDEDEDWFADQAEGFRRLDAGEPLYDEETEGDKTWVTAVADRAMEIAKRDGRGHPEEGDFNAAMIDLGDIVPQRERDALNRDLQAIEEGRSSGNN